MNAGCGRFQSRPPELTRLALALVFAVVCLLPSGSYWGYRYMEQVEGNMTAFRDGDYPIDSFIMDYE